MTRVSPISAFSVIAACALLLAACIFESDNRVAGGGSETEYFTLTGTLGLPDGAPAARCRITIRPAEFLFDPEFPPGRNERDTVTDAKGVFSVKGLAAGKYLVEAYSGDSLGFTAQAELANSTDGKFAPVFVVGGLQRTGTLTIALADPVPDLDYNLQIYGMRRRALAGSSGSAKVTLPPGEYRVRVISNSKDLAPALYTTVRIRSGADTVLTAVHLPPANGSGPVPLIFDSNIGFAVDDAAALTLLHALADRGEARILAVGTTNRTFASPAVLDIIDTYHGRGDIPVGVWKGEKVDSGTGYDKQVASEFPYDLPAWDAIPSAATVYRKALESQPDGAAVMVCTGDVRNAWALLRASRELVARKVRLLVVIGGGYPAGREFNFAAGVATDTLPNMIREVARDWPTPIHFAGTETGEDMTTGGCLASAAPGGPLKRIYDLRLAPNAIKPSTDLVGLLYAVRGPQSFWTLVNQGGNVIGDDGSNVWNAAPETDQSYLIRKGGPESVAASLDSLLCAIPAP